MASVIAVQSLLFQDGGLLAMGANIVNMGVIGTMGGFAIYMALCRLLGERSVVETRPQPSRPGRR